MYVCVYACVDVFINDCMKVQGDVKVYVKILKLGKTNTKLIYRISI